MDNQQFKKESPYPYPKNIIKNPEYARILKKSFSGSQSELTGILQYIYHHIRFRPIDETMAHCLEKIAIVEMHHFDLLGQLVEDLGLDPRYTQRSGFFDAYWNAGAIAYGRTALEMLQGDLHAEGEAIALYRQTLDLIPDPEIQNLILRIIEDEELHLAWFASAVDSVKKEQGSTH